MIRRKLTIFACFIILVLGSIQIGNAQNRPGSVGAEFIRVPVSARAAGMGGAYIAVTDGADAMYYNPAALVWTDKNTNFFANHTSYLAEINHEYFSVTRQSGNNGYGMAITALYTDLMEETTPQQPGGTGRQFYVANYRGSFGYARKMTQKVSLGVKASVMHMRLFEGIDEQSVGFDIAADYHANFRDFRFAMKIANLGSEVKFVNESYPLPIKFEFGASMNAIEMENHQLKFSGSAFKPNDGDPRGQAGLEYAFNNLLYLRGGYKIDHDTEDYTAGMGLNMDVSGYVMQFNYGYSNFGDLGKVHRFGVEVRM